MSSDDPTDVDLVGNMLRDSGYKALVDPTTNVVQSGANGFNFVVIVFPDSLQFHCSVTLPEGAQVPTSEMNRINGAFRFIRMFFDTDLNGLVVQNDHFYDVRGHDAAEKFAKLVHLFDGSIQSLKDLYVRLQAEVETASQGGDAVN